MKDSENTSGSDNSSENTESRTSKPENEILNTADTTDAIESANQDQDKPLTRITNDDLVAAKNANINETIAERIAYAINNNKDMTSTVVVPAMGMLLDDINERPLNSFEQSQYLKTYDDLVKAFNYFHLDPNQYLDPEKYPDPKSLGILSDEERAEQDRRNKWLVDLADKLFDYLSDNKTIAEFISDKKISEQDVADALNRIGMGDISVPIDENKVRKEMGISELKTQPAPKTDQQNINTAENSNEESVQTPTSETSKTPETEADIPEDDEKKPSNNSATTYTIENKEKLISDYSAKNRLFPKEYMEQIVTNVLDDLNYDKFSAKNEIINIAKNPGFQDIFSPAAAIKSFYIATIKAVIPKNIQTEGYLEKLEKLDTYDMDHSYKNEGYTYAKTPEEFISKMTKALTDSPASFDMYARILYKSEFNPRMQNRIANSIIYNLFNNGSKDTAEKFSKALNSYGISAATDETISTADTYVDPEMAKYMDYTAKESSDEPKEYNSETKKETIRERYNQPYSTDTKGKYAEEIDNEIKTILRSLKLPLENNKFAKWRKSNTADNSQFEHAINNICSQMPMGQYILDQVQNCIDTDTQLNAGRLDRDVVSVDLNSLLNEVYREIFDVIMENKPFLSKTLFKTQSKYGAVIVRIWQAIRSGCVKYIAKELNLADADVDREIIRRISKPRYDISKDDDKLDRVWIESEIQIELIREQKLQMLMEMNQDDIKSES